MEPLPPETPSPAAGLTFDAAPYRPEGGFTQPGAVLLLGLELLAAAVLGWIAGFIAQWLYLILIFPLAIGLALGGIGMVATEKGRVRSPFLGGVAGLLGGCAAMFVMHYTEYFRVTGVWAEQAGVAPEVVRDDISFFDFMDIAATEGVVLQRAGGGGGGGGGGGLNLGYVGSYIYGGVEVLIVAGIAFAMVRSRASEPYCSACNRWKHSYTLGTLQPPQETLTAILAAGDLGRLGGQVALEGGPFVLTAVACPECGPVNPIEVRLQNPITNPNGHITFKTLAQFTYPGAALPALEALFQAKTPESQAAEPSETAPKNSEPEA